MIDIKQYMLQIGEQARVASYVMAKIDSGIKNKVLEDIANSMMEQQQKLLDANTLDLRAGENSNLDAALMDRLELTPDRIEAMAEGLRQVAALADPIGSIDQFEQRPSGIKVGCMRVPLGVIGIIYESRPNVTADAAALCIKSGNATILRGGSEAVHSNHAIAGYIQQELRANKLPIYAVQCIKITDRAAVDELITMSDYVDVIIPRGGKGLIKRIKNKARIPVIKHLDGICHVYIDALADLKKAIDVAYNSKTQRYGTCNTMECLLVAEDIAAIVLKKLVPMYQKAGVEIRGCEKSQSMFSGIQAATEDDYQTEYLAPIMSLRIVKDMDEAIRHIHKYGSQHTDAIVTDDQEKAARFLREVDSSSVMVNASTRFADGFEYGLGAEIGISTDKFHARGPVGLLGLTSQKYVVIGDGHIR